MRREMVGVSQAEDPSLCGYSPGAGSWHISNDITQDSINSIIEFVEELFA